MRILDIGTGAGNLAIALAAHLPQAVVDATDVSEKALDLAHENAARAGLADRVHTRYWDIFSDKIPSTLHPPYSLVVSNPPYVAEADFDTLPPEVKDFEPKIALIAGPDGLRFYYRFTELARLLLEKDGAFVVEIGETQASSVRDIFASIFRQIELFRDLSGADRVIVAEGLRGSP